MKNTDDKDVRTLDIVTHEVGLLELEDGRSTPDDRRWANDVATSMHARIAEYRRNRLARSVPIKKAAPISERLLAMPRATLEALFGSLVEQWGPQAHWWCVKPDGTIVDPSVNQFPRPHVGEYVEFDGFCECEECGKRVAEADAVIVSNYAFCSTQHAARFVGL